ncbi:MAG TPA: hypothetical protein VH682_15865 [Gemmataceae bacterium]|jgi:hypothetical protein
MLPDSKDGFPKCLYLDQNKWIDLSRAHYGRPDGEAFQPALKAVREAVQSGRLVAPMSIVNLLEATSHKKPEPRERLARFMVDLSGNLAILPFMAVYPWEINNAVRAAFSDLLLLRIRAAIVVRGVHNALGKRMRIDGLPPEEEAKVIEELNGPDMSVKLLLAEGNARNLHETARKGDEEIAQICERKRAAAAAAKLSPEQRLGCEVAELCSQGVGRQWFMKGLKEVGVSLEDCFAQLRAKNKEKEFFRGMPSINVFLSLIATRDQELTRPIDRNDYKDIMGLAVAMPYCNLVVSEKHWGHMAKRLKFDKQYDTILITDARELPEKLAAIGCV